MSRRMFVVVMSAWIAVVIAGSALAWVAIDRAGRQVTGNPDPAATLPAVVGTVGSAPTRTGTAKPQPPHATRTSPTSPGHSPTAPATSSPPPTPKRSASEPPRTASPETPVAQTRTWSGGSGTVTVSCTGRTARLEGTSPADGWHVEVGDGSGSEVEVTFKRNESEVQVKATCVDGVPRFHVEADSTGSGSYDATSGRDD